MNTAATKAYVLQAISDTMQRNPEAIPALVWMVNELGIGPVGDTPESRARHKKFVEEQLGLQL